MKNHAEELRRAILGASATDDLDQVLREGADEIDRLRATANIPATWDGVLTIETEVFINGIRYDPGTYRVGMQRLSVRKPDAQF